MRHRPTLVAVLCCVALGGCAGTSPGASPSAIESQAASGPEIRLIGSEPVLHAEDLGHYGAILPSAFFEADGALHAYLVGFGDAIGDQQVFHATSVDGLAWEVDAEEPMRDLGLDLSPPGPIPASVLPAPGGGWMMFFWGAPAPDRRGAVLWRATAESPAGPWLADPEPVLPLGESGAWDDVALDFPSVLPAEEGYVMLYSAVGSSSRETTAIGRATSPDGVSWAREDGPLLQAGSCFASDYSAAPRVLRTADGWLMLYNADRRVGATRSDDGVSWACAADAPILTAADVPNSEGIHTFATTPFGDRVLLLVESLVAGGSEVWLAELEDAG
jgi:hypothetical protein